MTVVAEWLCSPYCVFCTVFMLGSLDFLAQLCEVRVIYHVHGNSCNLIQFIEDRFIIIFLEDLSN